MDGTPFQKRVWLFIQQIPRGKVATYQTVAHAIRCASPRAVGQALKRNPDAPCIPCHRVVASTGLLGGYAGTSPRKIAQKKQLLEQEGVLILHGKIDLDTYGWSPYDQKSTRSFRDSNTIPQREKSDAQFGQ
ncbi:MAG: MGMT family protein [Nanoarchaeota archaeon]|nr:MGMT family protein [Nanoarchaeota archaeon]